ncbi:hypothetical protein LMJF_36_0655 [Leishmania major strain Friedlin]|uniref:Uncharacterized protein n=1 Tax=Leishmania major TaxID=5664 RepID=E9AG13_LEIMA|nr:hypothetical protein LMJF_36_0655 [Leishmania major strain Friedlin]CBZ05897.1 hypothetical protein LMJF_36_0655 [Leishmania major strain Friedlin]|eukprot:XP_003722933.1 hypothetical protein LMJF_36_0655 [Leishmania major strain Friedlin]
MLYLCKFPVSRPYRHPQDLSVRCLTWPSSLSQAYAHTHRHPTR